MNPLDDTLLMGDDTDVMPACSLPTPPKEPAAPLRNPATVRRRVAFGAWATAALACAGITLWALATVGAVMLVLLSGAAPG